MKEWTGIEIQRAQQGLEHAAAVVLGRMLFEFAKLDMALGLVLVWSDGGKQLDKRTKEVTDLSFHKRLDLLRTFVATLYAAGQSARALYDVWLEDAHSVRLMRNELVHGRWGCRSCERSSVQRGWVADIPESANKGLLRLRA